MATSASNQRPWPVRLWHALFGSPTEKAVDAEIKRGQTERRKHANTMVMHAPPPTGDRRRVV